MPDALEAALAELRALCSGGLGPCGAQTLLFRPPDAPVVTGSGYAVLSAWKEALDAKSPAQSEQRERRGAARLVLSAVDGLQREVGDGACELVLLLHAVTKLVSAGSLGQDGAHRRQLSRAFESLKWTLWDELAAADKRRPADDQLQIPVNIELAQLNGRQDDSSSLGERLEPSGEFRLQLFNVLRSALNGLFGPDACEFLCELVVEWLFRVPWPSSTTADSSPVDARMLFQRVQMHLKHASSAVMFLTSPSLRNSNVLPPGDFILRQSIVGAQQHHQFALDSNCLSVGTGAVRFVCITCPLSLDHGGNSVTVSVPKSSLVDGFDDWLAVKDVTRSFISRYLQALSSTHGVCLLINTEPIKEEVVAMCTRYGISCVQFAEPDEVTALGVASGTIALASLFDEIVEENHVGQCSQGVATLRLQHRPCLRLCGVAPATSRTSREGKHHGLYHAHAVVPQLLLHAASKGIYKHYYAGIVKALRVLQGWFKTSDREPPTRLHVCRGAGAVELSIARRLHAIAGSGRDNLSLGGDASMKHGDLYARQARRVVADALLEGVVQLQQNLQLSCGADPSSLNARRHVLALLAESSRCGKAPDTDKEGAAKEPPPPLYVLDQQCQIETKAGVITCPQLAQSDPKDVGLVHPWARTEALLFQMLSTVEQLFRIEAVVHIKRVKALVSPEGSEEESTCEE